MDVSRKVAEALRFQRSGTAKIKVEYVGRASLAGSDDARLYATLHTNGPARWDEPEPTVVAEAEPPPPPVMAPPVMAPPPIVPVAPPPPPHRVREAMMPEGPTIRDPAARLPERAMPERYRPVAVPRVEEYRPVVLPRSVLERPVKEPVARVASFAREPMPVERPLHVAAREPERPSPRGQSASERALERILAAEEPVSRPRGGSAAQARFEPAHYVGPAHVVAPRHVMTAHAEPDHAEPDHVEVAHAEPAHADHVRPDRARGQGEGVPARVAVAHAPLPPARPMDLGTIPGAGSAIGAPRPPRNPLRLARSRDE
jgi:rare lipoprotein A